MPNKLTFLIPCKNEVENLAACVQAAGSIADEVLVADSGSTDGTLDVARGLGCRIIRREYVDCGDFKNWAIPQAKYEWVLVVDADERVTPELAAEIHELLWAPPEYDGYSIRRLNYFMGHPVRHGDWGKDTVIRLFQRDVGRYAIHTDHTEINLPPHRVGSLRHSLLHYACWSYDTYFPKMLRYTSQQARLWYEEGKRPSALHLALNGPMRFLRSYVFERGFLDGWVGFQLAALTCFYSFLKQAQLWELHYSKRRTQDGQTLGTTGTVPYGLSSSDARSIGAAVAGVVAQVRLRDGNPGDHHASRL